MPDRRYSILERLRAESNGGLGLQANPRTKAPPMVGVEQIPTYQAYAECIVSFITRLYRGRELNASQLKKLRTMALDLMNDTSTQAEALSKQIAEIKDLNLRVHSLNYIQSLEDEYDKLHREFQLSTTSPERKAEIAEVASKISQTLRILQR